MSVMNDLGKEEEFDMISDIWFWEGSDKHPALKFKSKESPADQRVLSKIASFIFTWLGKTRKFGLNKWISLQ